VTAAVPSPYLSPTAGLFNRVVAYFNRRLADRELELTALLVIETERGHALRTAADFADSERSGYIDRTGLEGL
jgi:hypothetical protein